MEPDGGWKIGFSNQKYASLEYYTIGSMISIKFVVPNWVPKTQVQFPRALLHQKLQGSLRSVPCSAKTSWWQLKYFWKLSPLFGGSFPFLTQVFSNGLKRWREKWKVFFCTFLPISWWRCVQKLPGGACPGEPDGKGDWTMSALHGYTSTSCYLDFCLFLVFPAAQVRQNFRF